MMGFTESVRTCYARKYATFSGRATRSEFWFLRLFIFLVIAAFGALFVAMGGFNDGGGRERVGISMGILGLLFVVFIFATVVPAIAVSVRRVHDTNASGWLVLTWFIPYVGGIIGTVWACLPGTKGDNRFGADPTADVSIVFE